MHRNRLLEHLGHFILVAQADRRFFHPFRKVQSVLQPFVNRVGPTVPDGSADDDAAGGEGARPDERSRALAGDARRCP